MDNGTGVSTFLIFLYKNAILTFFISAEFFYEKNVEEQFNLKL